MNTRSTIGLGLILATLGAIAPVAYAEPNSRSSVRESLPTDARGKFDEGLRLYGSAEFAAAREAFLAAHGASGDARVLYNVAVCEKALGQYARAIGTLKRSLAPTDRVLPSDYTQRVAETIATLSRYVAFVTVDASVEGASITVDGEPLRENPVALDAGSHTFVATKEGYERATYVSVTRAGEASRVTIDLEPSLNTGSAKVTCAGVPRCEISIGDEVLGPAPVTFSRALGSYVVRATVEGRLWSERTVELVKGKTIEVDLVASSTGRAHLRVTTDNADDVITVDGVRSGRSGVDVALAPGEHHVAISRAGGGSKSFDVLLRDRETRDMRVTLEDRKAGLSPWWFIGGGALLAAGAVTTAVIVGNSSASTTRFEGNSAGTLNPYVIAAAFRGGQ